MDWRRGYRALPFLLLLSAIGCDGNSPLAPGPAGNASVSAGSSPSAPSNATAVAASQTQINISWRDNSADESGFEIHRSTTGAGGVFSLLSWTGANATSYSDRGLTPASEYCYKVLAFRTLGATRKPSAFSNTSCAKTLPPAPSAPSGDGVTCEVVARLPANSASYSDRAVSPNTTYSYIVGALKDGGLSDLSTVASARAGALQLGRIVTWGNTMMKFTGSAAFRALLGDEGGDTDDYVLVRNILQHVAGKSSNVRTLYTDACDPRTDPDVCFVGGLEYLQPFYDMVASIGTITYADLASAQIADFDVVVADFCSLPSQDYDVLRSYLSSGGAAMVLGDNFCGTDEGMSAWLANSVIADLGVFFLDYELYASERFLITAGEQVGLLTGVSNLGLWRVTPQYISQGFVPIATWNANVLYTIRTGALTSHIAATSSPMTHRMTAGPRRTAEPGPSLVERLANRAQLVRSN